MPGIKEFNIIDPPTGGEVQSRALEALKTSGLLKLTLLGQEDIPQPEPGDIEFRIRQTVHPTEGGMLILGMLEENSVRVNVPSEAGLPATASVVTA